MAQIDYDKIKRRNIEHSKLPKMFSELKEPHLLYVLDIDTLIQSTVIVSSVEIDNKIEKDYNYFTRADDEYHYSEVKVEIKYGNDRIIELKCYGSETFVVKNNKVYFTRPFDSDNMWRILMDKCRCQVNHLATMFNGVFPTKQCVDRNNIVLG